VNWIFNPQLQKEEIAMTLTRWTPRSEIARTEWDPFAELRRLQDEMLQLFDSSLARRPFNGVFSPAVDVSEDKDNVIVKADLPGLTKDDVEITLQDNVLTLRGEKKQQTERKEENFYRMERVHGTFSRSFELPVAVNANKVAATFKDGVLHITLPKAEEAKPKQIKVNVQ
jgi:HSP20 family protein